MTFSAERRGAAPEAWISNAVCRRSSSLAKPLHFSAERLEKRAEAVALHAQREREQGQEILHEGKGRCRQAAAEEAGNSEALEDVGDRVRVIADVANDERDFLRRDPALIDFPSDPAREILDFAVLADRAREVEPFAAVDGKVRIGDLDRVREILGPAGPFISGSHHDIRPDSRGEAVLHFLGVRGRKRRGDLHSRVAQSRFQGGDKLFLERIEPADRAENQRAFERLKQVRPAAAFAVQQS